VFEQVSAALDRKQYGRAAALLKEWQRNTPQDPWLQVAIGHYYAARGELERAQTTYTRLLQNTGNTKVLLQAREGVQRVKDLLAQHREHELLAAQQRPGADAPAVLVLLPVSGDQRQAAAQGLAAVMQIDVYTAKLRIPSQHWRLFRVGSAGELQYFCEKLQSYQTPAFWVPVTEVKSVPVFRVQHVQAYLPKLQVICRNHDNQLGTIALDWAEVNQGVIGQLPIFESVVDLDPWGKLTRKGATQDYAEIIDLHLQGRKCILRFCDRSYNYQQGASVPGVEASPNTAIAYWQAMKTYLQTYTDLATAADFKGFGSGALDLIDLLPHVDAHIDVSRTTPTAWDLAFHLYSCLRFLQAWA
jgi:tetratricopeptide (TPR) repeat protein